MNKKLIEVLVGENYRIQYLTNPQFKYRVDILASTLENVLPLIVEGFATRAEQIQKDFNEQFIKKTMGWGSF